MKLKRFSVKKYEDGRTWIRILELKQKFHKFGKTLSIIDRWYKNKKIVDEHRNTYFLERIANFSSKKTASNKSLDVKTKKFVKVMMK